MAHPLHHAMSSVRKWGGTVEDYLPIHNWFDESKAFHADFRHRALRHHAEGIFLCEKIFGVAIKLANGRSIPVRWIGEQHILEDLGRIPAASEWLSQIQPQRWMMTKGKTLSAAAEKEETQRHNASVPGAEGADSAAAGREGAAETDVSPAPCEVEAGSAGPAVVGTETTVACSKASTAPEVVAGCGPS